MPAVGVGLEFRDHVIVARPFPQVMVGVADELVGIEDVLHTPIITAESSAEGEKAATGAGTLGFRHD
jgi:hypothetical protein